MNEWLERRSGSNIGSNREFKGAGNDTPFQRDRARIIHSASFRALQSKTQVLGLGESDFYRTRLTHSLEVAQIGSGICDSLRNHCCNNDQLPWIPSFNLIEAVCLAHDLGHSPFGHGGEVALNYMMRNHGGFEANGQTLRILARLGEFSETSGLDLTRRTMLGTIKYPVFYSEVVNYPSETTRDERQRCYPYDPSVNIDQWTPPKCLYDSESDIVEWILQPLTNADRSRLRMIHERDSHHHRSVYKCLDTSIMELADDIAYGVHDLEDALALGLISQKQWLAKVCESIQSLPDNAIAAQLDFYNSHLFDSSHSARKHAISKLVGYFISNISLETDNDFEHPLLSIQASMNDTAYAILKLVKDFVMHEVILRPELQALQYKGQQVIIRLFTIFAENPDRLLPRDVHHIYQQAEIDRNGSGYRIIADFICSMTDVSAARLYHKLMTPSAGSIFDRT